MQAVVAGAMRDLSDYQMFFVLLGEQLQGALSEIDALSAQGFAPDS